MTEGLTFEGVETQGPTPKLIPLYDPQVKDRVFSRGDVHPEDLLIFVHERLVEDILRHVCRHRRQEVGGVLVGGYHVYNTLRFVEVRSFIRAEHAVSRNLSLRFTHDTWDSIHQEMGRRFPDERLVGWYHSHPRSGIYFSGNDVFIHRNFFSLPWQVALVLDPQKRAIGFFHWREEDVVPCGYYFISDSLTIT